MCFKSKGDAYHDDLSPFQFHLNHLSKLLDQESPGQFYLNGKVNKFNNRSFGFDNRSKFRFSVAQIVTSRRFENFILVLILFYSVLLGMKDYVDETAPVNVFIGDIDPIFNAIVYLEFVLKCIAMGFTTYMADGWNWIDFFVVVTSAAQDTMTVFYGESAANLSALRAFRLLRPLKLLNSIPSLKMLLGTLIASIKSLSSIFVLICFLFTIFGILGVALWQGKIHYRCYDTPGPVDGEW